MKKDLIISLYFVSGSKRLQPGEKYSNMYGKSLSSNGRNSANFDNISIKLSKEARLEVRFHPMLSKYQNSKTYFYEVITNEIYLNIILVSTWIVVSGNTRSFYIRNLSIRNMILKLGKN